MTGNEGSKGGIGWPYRRPRSSTSLASWRGKGQGEGSSPRPKPIGSRQKFDVADEIWGNQEGQAGR